MVLSQLLSTWLIVFSICTKPRLGSMVLMKSTMDSRLSCCRIKGLWLPSRLKATLKITSDPCRNNISDKQRGGKKNSEVKTTSVCNPGRQRRNIMWMLTKAVERSLRRGLGTFYDQYIDVSDKSVSKQIQAWEAMCRLCRFEYLCWGHWMKQGGGKGLGRRSYNRLRMGGDMRHLTFDTKVFTRQ